MHNVILLGDSMIDTFDFAGQQFPELQRALKELSPDTIELHNHGVGSTTVELGLERLTQPFEYLDRGRHLPAVLAEKPDLVIVESFAYNHWSNSPEDVEKYISCHQKILDTLRTQTEVIFLATIAPNRELFAKAILNLNWNEERRVAEYETVMNYLQTFLRFAQQTGVPVVDCFTASLDTNGTGNPDYISNVDYLHLSYQGRECISQHLAPVIISNLSKK